MLCNVKNAKACMHAEDIERYELTNRYLIDLALKNYKDILFRLKTCKPSKRGYFTRTVINYLDEQQRNERAFTTDNEPKQYFGYFIEEAQDTFNIRSTLKLEAEEFLARFNEGRNNREAFFTSSQRLFDFAKTIRSKQLYCLGKTALEDITTFHRKLEKEYNVNFAKLLSRNWFFEGQTFKSPEWKQEKKPYQINSEVKQKYLDSLPKPQKTEPILNVWFRQKTEKHKTLKNLLSFLNFLFGIPKANENRKPQKKDTDEDEEEDGSVLISENSEQQSEEIFW